MKLSEAIRQGAARRPQGHGTFFPRDPNGAVCSCAFGSAYEGTYGGPADDPKTVWSGLRFNYPELGHVGEDATPVIHPVDGFEISLNAAIIDLNDRHEWSRERIADWLGGIGY